MSKAIALAAFNTAVVITNVAHAAKRGAVKAASQSKEASISFWAGMKYAHQQNKANAAAAELLTAEDIEASERSTPEDIEASEPSTECLIPEVIEASKPSTKRSTKRSAK